MAGVSNAAADLDSNDLRCNVGATGEGTETIEMQAGESFSFTLDTVSGAPRFSSGRNS